MKRMEMSFSGQNFLAIALEVDFDVSAGIVYFGEYVTKQKKVAAVSVWSYELERTELVEVVQISGVRHVHFVKIQPETKTLVLGTRDKDEESKLICVSLEKEKCAQSQKKPTLPSCEYSIW